MLPESSIRKAWWAHVEWHIAQAEAELNVHVRSLTDLRLTAGFLLEGRSPISSWQGFVRRNVTRRTLAVGE